MVTIKSTNIWDLKPACKKKAVNIDWKAKESIAKGKVAPGKPLFQNHTEPIRPFKRFRIKYHNAMMRKRRLKRVADIRRPVRF